MKKRLFLELFLFIFCFYYVAEFCNEKTDGFSVARIHSTLPLNPAWESAPLGKEEQHELEQALSQPFHYLGCGGQCFAFSSEDERYVIKFFKHRIRKPYSLLCHLPLPKILEEKRERRDAKALVKLNRDFTSYKYAFEELKEETGIFYIHLNKGTSLNRTVSITDKLGIKHTIALDNIEFVVQKKAQLVHSRIDDLVLRGNAADTKKALHAMLDVIVSRCKKGFYDEDPRIHRNFGFVGDQPVLIDVGRFVKDATRQNPEVYKNDLRMITKRFRHWLQEAHPPLVTMLDEELETYESMD